MNNQALLTAANAKVRRIKKEEENRTFPKTISFLLIAAVIFILVFEIEGIL